MHSTVLPFGMVVIWKCMLTVSVEKIFESWRAVSASTASTASNVIEMSVTIMSYVYIGVYFLYT